jgi:hypothetical protein
MSGIPKCALSIHSEQEFSQALGKFCSVSAATGKIVQGPSEPTDGFLFSQPQIALRDGGKDRVMESEHHVRRWPPKLLERKICNDREHAQLNFLFRKRLLTNDNTVTFFHFSRAATGELMSMECAYLPWRSG